MRSIYTNRFVPLYVLFLITFFYACRGPRQVLEEGLSPPALDILIPKTVHQLLISMPGHPVSTFEPNGHTTSWQQSGWKIEYWSEDSCAQLAQDNATSAFSETFQQLPTSVLRSDFCRYLVLFRSGGVYNDLDVHLIKPLPWNVMGPLKGKGPPGLIVGLEGDASTKGLPKSPQFVQWTIASKPSHPILQDVLDRIAKITPSRQREQATNKNKEIDIMGWTGPSVWTEAVLDYLDCTEEQMKKLRNLEESLRIKDVLVLPKRAFAVIQGEDHTSPDILVKHYFSGTWKKCDKSWLDWVIPWGC